MSQYPDIFNINMGLDPNLPFIKGIKGLTITRGQVNNTALSLVRALLYAGVKKGDLIAIVMPISTKSIISEVACYLGGYPFISLRSTNNIKDVEIGKQKLVEKIYKTTNYRIKYVITVNSYRELLLSKKVDYIENYPEPQDLMYFGLTSGTTSSSSIGKLSLCTRELVEKQIILNKDDNGVIDDHTCNWYAFGNPYLIYHSRTIQTLILNRGSIILHDPKNQTINSIIETINELQPTRFSYLKPLPPNVPGRDEFFKINPLLVLDLMERPTKELLTIFKSVKLSPKVLRSFKMIGDSNIKNSIELIREIENIQPSIRFYNSFGSSETIIKMASDPDDSLENRLLKHGKNKWGDSIIRLEDDGQMLINLDYTTPYTENYESFVKDNIWFKTANRFRYDENGYFEFLERINNY